MLVKSRLSMLVLQHFSSRSDVKYSIPFTLFICVFPPILILVAASISATDSTSLPFLSNSVLTYSLNAESGKFLTLIETSPSFGSCGIGTVNPCIPPKVRVIVISNSPLLVSVASCIILIVISRSSHSLPPYVMLLPSRASFAISFISCSVISLLTFPSSAFFISSLASSVVIVLCPVALTLVNGIVPNRIAIVNRHIPIFFINLFIILFISFSFCF